MKDLISKIRIQGRILLAPIASAVFFFLFWMIPQSAPRWLPLSVLVVGVALPFFVGTVVTRTLLRSLDRISQRLRSLANGDFTRRPVRRSRDEIDDVGMHLEACIENLREIMVQFAKGSFVAASTARHLDNSTKEMAEGVEHAAAQTGVVAAASEEMSTTFSEIARNCTTAAESADRAHQSASGGRSIIDETIAAMDRISEMVKRSAKIMEVLGGRSEQIGEVVSLINEIADQTNLLALNAAIEAARAGEHGRGFAVVADEVRKLAEKTTAATKEIGETIKAMQGETKAAAHSMDQGVKEVDAGAEHAKMSGGALREILDQIGSVSSEVNQIAVASEQQTATMNEIAASIQEISAVMEQTSRSVGQGAKVASELTDMSVGIRKIVGQFRVATKEDAQEMVKKAVAYAKAHGKERAIAEFHNPKGEFIEGDLYVLMGDFNGYLLAHGANPGMAGVCAIDGKDAKGKYLSRGMIEVAKTKGSGWFEFAYENPYTKKVQEKLSYIERVDDYYIACGVYK